MLGKEIIQQNADRLIFALDTGTRSIVGVLGIWEENVFTILDYEQYFHEMRAMRDGQIEDIHLVAQAIRTVKDALEQRWDITLTRVSIAAAGRALKTVAAEYEQDISPDHPVDDELIRSIEYGAVSQALDSFSSPDQSHDFSCVGYSVSGYWMDNYKLINLEGQRGSHAKVGIIAAFLPLSVVRSLYAATGLCGLEVASLTLEPIAAINAIVPKDLRLLNIAIADIGAGTSDIAVTKNGSVVAYDMVTIAGDEITEALMQQYLTDFDTAEQIKLSLSGAAEIKFTDILGNPYSLPCDELLHTIEPASNVLSDAIADSILRVNGNPPVAVFLIGGGSQLPGLCKRIAERLELPENRVALGGRQPYKYIKLCSDDLMSPEFVTPVGIGAVSTLYQGSEYLSVVINDQKVMIPGSGDIRVVDALLLAGIRSSSLIGRTPPSIVFYLNSEPKTLRSTPSIPGELYLNGEPATLNSSVRQSDRITFIPAKNGFAPRVTLADLCECKEDTVCTVNGEPCSPDYVVEAQDDIRVFTPSEKPSSAQAEADQAEAAQVEAVQAEAAQVEAKEIHVTLNGERISVLLPESGSLNFVDMLNYVEIDPQKPEGDLILSINGSTAAYLDPVSDGDCVEIRWSKQELASGPPNPDQTAES